MQILFYNELDSSKVKKQFAKTLDFLLAGDFKSADTKKMANTGYYRAKLDAKNRLLFKFARYNNQTYLLVLEVILEHDYAKSRFLRGASADLNENALSLLTSEKQVPADEISILPFVRPKESHFHLLNKVISFDQDQQELFNLPTPLIIIGSAGSGKTALTLEKTKTLRGKILYVTLSQYLSENSANLYYANGYENEHQELDFLSFKELLETIRIIPGKEITFRTFEGWFTRHRQGTKLKDAHKLFEEFKGVLTGMRFEQEYMSKADYLSLGVKQSVFLAEEREQVYGMFEKYRQFLIESQLYDLNIISHQWVSLAEPRYDFIVVDEVQDLTNVQIYLILRLLTNPVNFILCGDANQIVHPNFFSWSNVKTMFYQSEWADKEIRILKTNYRNSPQVTDLANKLLKIKNARFGSIDKESAYLVNSVSDRKGEVLFLEDSQLIKQELNQKTKSSTHFAVLVMTNEDKEEARKWFQTPLLFSVHEAKGLEYENIILVNFISNHDKEFREITDGVSPEEVAKEELIFSRGKDKTDKSLDVYKFFVNSLYVAITRSVQNLYLVESSSKHRILQLLGLVNAKQQLAMQSQNSSRDEWNQEARKLELQGKTEHAEQIRKSMLGIQPTPWTPLTLEEFVRLKKEALDPINFNKKAKDRIFDFALIYNDTEVMQQLSELKYRRADKYEAERNSIYRKHYQDFKNDDVSGVMLKVNKYGVNYRDEFNQTPLLAAVQAGGLKVTKHLLDNGADVTLFDNFGRNALQNVLKQTYFSPEFSKSKLGKLYPLVVSDSIKVKVDNHLIKIDNHKAEYFLLHYMIALQSTIIAGRRRLVPKGVRMDDLIETIALYPTVVLPEFRKVRTYLSAMFAKNEVNKVDPYNKKLFLRVERGFYLLNFDLEILIKDNWVNVYELMQVKIGKKKAGN